MTPAGRRTEESVRTIREMTVALGDGVLGRLAKVVRVAAVASSALAMAWRGRYWPRTVRIVLARQILFTGVDALGLVSLVALLAGVGVVTQAQVWLGQSDIVGALLVAVILRELGPLLVNFIVIARSGTAVATELAGMRVRGEIDVLDAQGMDPFVYLILPRVAGMALSVLALVVCFVAISLAGGYLFGVLLGVARGTPAQFMDAVFGAITPRDVPAFLVKTLLPPALTAAICCIEGLGVGNSVNEIPQAGTRAVVRSLAASLVVGVLASVLFYA